MSSPEPTKVLIVVGDAELARVAAAALAHPQIEVETAESEQSVVSALTTRQFDAVLVGGHIGRRGPLVLCDVVRLRQAEAKILVLLGLDVDEQQRKDHAERQLPNVLYLELAGVAGGAAQGSQIRAATLNATNIDEDARSAEHWLRSFSGACAAERNGGQPAMDEAEVIGEGDADFSVVVDGPDDVVREAPSVAGAVTEDDLAFVARMMGRTRGVDFRAPAQPTTTPEGTDRATARLRDRVRELERYVARVCHVYAGRQHDFDAAAERVAKAETSAAALDAELRREKDEALRQQTQHREQSGQCDVKLEAETRRATLAEARLTELTDELQRVREELRGKEAAYAGVLKQAQDAFTQLRDQSAQAFAFYERRVAEQEQQAQASQQEMAKLAVLQQQGADRLTELSQKLEEHAEAAGKLAAAQAMLNDQRESTQRAETRANQREGELAAAQSELARRVDEDARLRQQLDRDRELASGERVAAVSAVEQKLAAAEKTLDARQHELTDSQREQAALSARLEAAEQERSRLAQELEISVKDQARWQKVEGDLQAEVDRAKARGLESALDARLVAIEEHARLAAEAASRYADALSSLDQRTAKQAAVVDRVLRVLDAPEIASGGYLPPVEAARRLAERMRPEQHKKRPWLRPWFWVVMVVLVAAVSATVVSVRRSSKGSPSARSMASAQKNPAPSKGAPAVEATKAKPKEGVTEKASAAFATQDKAAVSAKAAAPAVTAPAAATPVKLVAAPPKSASADAKSTAAPAHEAVVPKLVAPVALAADERRDLRRKLFDSYKAKKWDDAIAAGTRLRAGGKIDWEAELNLARALRSAGRSEEAATLFKAFLAAYPENKYAAEAKSAIEAAKK